jgi:hypothetical protein
MAPLFASAERVKSVVPMMVEKLNFLLRDFSPAEFADLTRLLAKLVMNGDGVASPICSSDKSHREI